MKETKRAKKEEYMDELGVEPKTSCLQGRRATNYATRPNIYHLEGFVVGKVRD